MPAAQFDYKKVIGQIKEKFNAALKSEKDKQKVLILAGILCAAVVALDVTFIMKSQFESFGESGNKISALKKDIAMVIQESARLSKLKTQEGVPAGASLKAKKFLDETDEIGLMSQINKMANNNGVRIVQMSKPGKSAEKVQTKGALSGITSEATPYMIALEVSCDYHHCGSFINELENAPEFLQVDEMRIESDETNTLTQHVNLILRTYVKK